jgi:Asp-tRNA(Asn)/Glu-tRNA(Gln) amidotransferase A subunit family amidase
VDGPASALTLATARARIRAHADLNAFISLTEEEGEGPVVAVKDLVDVKGTITTAGGILLPPEPAAEDAPVIRRMREFGCVVVGKANLHEWAFGVTSSNPHYGPVRNPHDPARVAGGSSGGSAVAVAAGMCEWALGSDTGGSIRIPAAFCGVVGFKPTIGTVPTEGVFPLSRTLDTLGPLAADVRSAARALEMMSELTGLLPEAPRPLHGLKVGAAQGWATRLAPEVAAAWREATRRLPEVDLGDPVELSRPGLTILLVEAANLHARWVESHPESYGDDVLRLLRQGLDVSRRDYSLALLEQGVRRAAVEDALEGWDAVVAPATRVGPPLIGEEYSRADVTGFTRPFNTTGHPVITLPAPGSGLPVGVQVVGHFGQEGRLVETALALEAAWAARTPAPA